MDEDDDESDDEMDSASMSNLVLEKVSKETKGLREDTKKADLSETSYRQMGQIAPM